VYLEKAAGQGHAYAMLLLGEMYHARKEFIPALEWTTKAAEAGLPKAMYNLGTILEQGGEGMVAQDLPAAADWYRRAADAGREDAAMNLCIMYTLGRGWAGQIMPASSNIVDPRLLGVT